MITCPCCNGSGRIKETAPVPLSPMQFQIYDAVRRAREGLTGYRLLGIIYADRPDGGPENAAIVLRNQIWRANKRLAAVSQRIAGTTRGAGSVYRLYRTAA